jgi:pentatricopeptide repeat protein
MRTSLDNDEKLQLAYFCEDGIGGNADIPLAMELYSEVHCSQDVRGTVGLAECFARAGDHEQAEKYFRLAIDAGYVYAMYWYSRYLRDRGDLVLSDKYLLMAKNGGHPRAIADIGRIKVKGAASFIQKLLATLEFFGSIVVVIFIIMKDRRYSARRYWLGPAKPWKHLQKR